MHHAAGRGSANPERAQGPDVDTGVAATAVVAVDAGDRPDRRPVEREERDVRRTPRVRRDPDPALARHDRPMLATGADEGRRHCRARDRRSRTMPEPSKPHAERDQEKAHEEEDDPPHATRQASTASAEQT
jgi:hypothetical protein